jgi:hypothetical protein
MGSLNDFSRPIGATGRNARINDKRSQVEVTRIQAESQERIVEKQLQIQREMQRKTGQR